MPEREAWDGARAGAEGAVRDYGMDDAFPIADIDDILPGMIEGRSRVYYHFGRDAEFDVKLIGWVNRVRAQVKRGARAPHEFVALGHLLHDLRLYKTRDELRVMRKAAKIAAEAHVRAMRAARPGMNEHEIEAELLHDVPPPRRGAALRTDRRRRRERLRAALPRQQRAAARTATCCWSTPAPNIQCYASDITRTFPVSGRYSPEQRALYDVVLAAQRAAIARGAAGRPFDANHDAAVRTITGGPDQARPAQGQRSRRTCASSTYRRFYMHKTGHWLGLDVHDVGDYRVDGESASSSRAWSSPSSRASTSRPTRRASPAKWRGIGIRIEDDVVVTRGEPRSSPPRCRTIRTRSRR